MKGAAFISPIICEVDGGGGTLLIFICFTNFIMNNFVLTFRLAGLWLVLAIKNESKIMQF